MGAGIVREGGQADALPSDRRRVYPRGGGTRVPEGIVIAGGGIGGLAAALALARVGRRSVVLERSERLGEIGAGVQIAPNAFACFERLGIRDALLGGAVFVDRLRLMDGVSGEEICHVPLGEAFRARFANPYAVIHRADLHAALEAGCREGGLVELRPGTEAVDYAQDGAGVEVRTRAGERIRGAALIAADGLHSTLRARMLGDGPPRVSGHTTFRSVIPTEAMPEDLRWNAATLWAGPRCHIVHYPLKGGRAFNLVVTYHADAAEAVAGRPVAAEEVRRGFEHVHPRARRVIEHGRDWRLWVLCDRDPVMGWVDGRVALLGDAAHPMLQYFAQGAAMALEDGVTLAHAVASHDRIEDALEAYRSERALRTARVVMGSRLIGDLIYHAEGAAAAVRDAAMRAKTPEDWHRTLDWLYGWRAPEATAARPVEAWA